MAETAHLVKYPMYVEDLGLGAGTATITIQSTGYTRTLLDSRNFPLSSAIKTVYGLGGTQYLDAVLTTLSTTTAVATTTTNGITKVDDNASSNPICLTTVGTLAGRIPSAAIYNALTGSAQTPDYGNAYVTRYEQQLALSMALGSGKDGHGKLGAIAASSTAPTITSVATSGLLTGTYTYKIAAYNLSGAIVASSASASTGAITSKQVRLTLPALPTNGMGWRIYRSTDGANWYLVGIAVKGFNYTETASDAKQYIFDDNNPTPNTSQSAPGSDTTGQTATLSGLYQFITFTTVASDAITVASSGNTAGILDIRIQGLWTGAETAWSITATGANAVNVAGMRQFGAGFANYSILFTGVPYYSATFTTAVAVATATVKPLGIGADASFIGRSFSGFGTKGANSGGNGGYGGGFVRIWGYGTATGTVGGTITVNGATGSNGAGGNDGGGGGGAGGWWDMGFLQAWKDIGTRNSNGGAGGTGTGTAYGGGGGGGGAAIRRNCYDKASATTSVAVGANGTNGGTSFDGGIGGANYGAGGQRGVADASAGQQFDFNGLYDPSTIFAA